MAHFWSVVMDRPDGMPWHARRGPLRASGTAFEELSSIKVAGFAPGLAVSAQRENEMFEALKTAISTLVKDAGARNALDDQDGRLATASLLIRVATVDGDMSTARRRALHATLKSGFGLDDLSTVQLIDDATAAERSAIDLYHFTHQLNDVLDDAGRHRTVRMMWEVVYADRSVNEVEDNIIWRAADLLSVSSRRRVELRQEVAGEVAQPAWR
jgi:uncharacterized tellurite resistance protein B-like protein